MELYFIRHAEAQTPSIDPRDPERLERLDRYGSGDYEGPLTERGREQAKDAGRFLARKGIETLLASPTTRARQTAEIALAEAGLESDILLMEELREARIGFLHPERDPKLARSMDRALMINETWRKITGRKVFLPVALYFVRLYMSSWLQGRTQGGESPDQVRDRIGRVLDRIAAMDLQGARIAVFTHGYVIYYLANHLVAPERKWRNIVSRPYVKNVSVTHLVRTRIGWALRSYAQPIETHDTFGFGGA